MTDSDKEHEIGHVDAPEHIVAQSGHGETIAELDEIRVRGPPDYGEQQRDKTIEPETIRSQRLE